MFFDEAPTDPECYFESPEQNEQPTRLHVPAIRALPTRPTADDDGDAGMFTGVAALSDEEIVALLFAYTDSLEEAIAVKAVCVNKYNADAVYAAKFLEQRLLIVPLFAREDHMNDHGVWYRLTDLGLMVIKASLNTLEAA